MATNAELFGLSTFIKTDKPHPHDKQAWEAALSHAYNVFRSEGGAHKSVLDFCEWAAAAAQVPAKE